jgi:hypothetical protein
MWIFSLFMSLILTGCSTSQKSANQNNVASNGGAGHQKASNSPTLYQNPSVNLKITQTGDWKKAAEKKSSKGLNLVFKENGLHAIVSVIPSTQSIQSIQSDLLKSVSHPAILSQSATTLDFQAGTKDKIRVLNYLKKKGNRDYVFSFVTPVKTFNQEKPVIQKFMANVQIN